MVSCHNWLADDLPFLVYLFNSNVHMGPLQISLGRMLFDISKFLFIYFLVLFAFANGLNQLYYKYGTKGVFTGNSRHKIIPLNPGKVSKF